MKTPPKTQSFFEWFVENKWTIIAITLTFELLGGLTFRR